VNYNCARTITQKLIRIKMEPDCTGTLRQQFVAEMRMDARRRAAERKLIDEKLSLRSDVPSQQLRRLTDAIRTLNVDAVRALIDEGVDVNFVVDGASPPICEALKSPYYETGDWVDDMPWAMAYNHIVTLLLDAGASLTAQDPEGWTVLHMAAFQRDLPLVEAALAAGANVNAADTQGRTPLHYAFMDGADQDVVQCIVNAGASLNAVDKQSRSPLFYAKYATTESVGVSFLEEAGALSLPPPGVALSLPPLGVACSLPPPGDTCSPPRLDDSIHAIARMPIDDDAKRADYIKLLQDALRAADM
jgi:hypothetical protein